MESSIPKDQNEVRTEAAHGNALADTDWVNRFFASYYVHRPVNATFIGVHDWDDRLPDFSEQGAGDTLADMQKLLAESVRIRDVAGAMAKGKDGGPVSFEDLDRRLAEGFLRIQLWEFQSNHFHRGNPSLYTGEAVFGLMSLFLADFAPLAERVEMALERMAALPTLLAQGRTNVRRAPQAWTQRALRECTGALAFLTGGIEHLLAECTVPVPGFRTTAEKAAAAFRDSQRYLETELLSNPVEEWACGEEALSLYMKYGHFLDQDPNEIVAYAESAMAEAAGALAGRGADVEDAITGLANLHPSAEDYYGRYQELWDSVRETAQAQPLLTWPDFPIRYVPRPRWARDAAPYLYFLFYRSPAALNRPPVHDYLVTPIDPTMAPEKQDELLRATNDSVIKLNHVIHHGSIGHHVQNWHAFRSRSRIGQIAAVDCASRIAMVCGGTMAEGWACYATDLMSEAGFLTPLEQVAELRGRTRMCARAIVDIRLHQGRLTLEQAADYYVRHAGMEPGPAHSEAVKNSMFPGAAAIYLLGTDAIHDLRIEMSVRLGSGFDLRSFHDEFLSYGSIPVSLIGNLMKGEVGHAE
ncbi:MAG: DUF885 family protein [Gemmatimonadota bacterium]